MSPSTRGFPARMLPVRCKRTVVQRAARCRSWVNWLAGTNVLMLAIILGLLVGALLRGETDCLPQMLPGLVPLGALLLLPAWQAIRTHQARRLLESLKKAREFGPLPPLRGKARWVTDRGLYDGAGGLTPWRDFSSYHVDHLVPEGHRVILWPAPPNCGRDLAQRAVLSAILLLGTYLEGRTGRVCIGAHGVTNDALIAVFCALLYLCQFPLALVRWDWWAGTTPEDVKPYVLLVNSETVSRDELETLLLNCLPRRPVGNAEP